MPPSATPAARSGPTLLRLTLGLIVAGALGLDPSPVAAAVADSIPAGRAISDSSLLQAASGQIVVKGANAAPESLGVAPTIAVPVFLGGKEIVRIRAERGGLTPEQRATAIRTRLSHAVADTEVPADSVRLLRTPQGLEVRLGPYFLWVLTPDDVAGLSASDVSAQVGALPGLLRAGIESERAARRPLGILIALLKALGLTIVAGLLLKGFATVANRWRKWLQDSLARHLGGIRVRNFVLFSQAQVAGVAGWLLAQINLLLAAVALYVYLALLFSLLPWTHSWSWYLVHFAGAQLMAAALAVRNALPGLMMIAIIVFAIRGLVGLLDRFFDAVESGAHPVPGFHPELARPSKRLVRIVLWTAAAVIAFPFIPGAQTKAFQGVSLFLGVLVSLGSTSIVGNVIAGLVLTYSRSFRVGDRVKIGDQMGDVENLGFFATKLRTIRNEEMTLPNGLVTSSPILNYTRLAADPGLILHSTVTIGYDAEWRKVHELLIAAALEVDGVEKDPEPWVYQRSLDDSYVSYEINCVTHESHPQLRLYSDLHAAIQDAFNRAGIEILSPAYQALRDGNSPALPAAPAGPRPEPGAFRVRND